MRGAVRVRDPRGGDRPAFCGFGVVADSIQRHTDASAIVTIAPLPACSRRSGIVTIGRGPRCQRRVRTTVVANGQSSNGYDARLDDPYVARRRQARSSKSPRRRSSGSESSRYSSPREVPRGASPVDCSRSRCRFATTSYDACNALIRSSRLLASLNFVVIRSPGPWSSTGQ